MTAQSSSHPDFSKFEIQSNEPRGVPRGSNFFRIINVVITQASPSIYRVCLYRPISGKSQS
jgi:hypothetical protein